ncbi:MAG: GTP cyclohydrolase 1 [Candidatus Woesearchaeota archaeon]|nr:MAG: GTP cyclohydrolase 1 [Candidatus Woesearchaeota archaeon]
MESRKSLFCMNKEDYLRTVSELIRKLLEAIGENPEREGLKDTPLRVAKMYRETLKGYCEEEKPKITVFNNEEGYTEMIIDEGYFYSMCEHHMVPFFGKVFVAYIPDKKIIGISKLARIVDHFAARLQVQERLTQQIARYLWETLEPKGVAVVMHARHLCREMRGIKKLNANMTTSELLGVFKEDPKTRAEFMGTVQAKLKE